MAPDTQMAEAAINLARYFPETPIVVVGLLEEAVPVARQLEEDGAEVIIARGGTLLALQKAGITVPLVEIQVSGKDLAKALEKAQSLVPVPEPRIGVLSYPSMIRHLFNFMPFMAMDIRCFELSPESNVEAVLQEALACGIDLILGGVIAVRLAQQLGIPAVLIESGEASLGDAMQEALRIAYARRLEKRRTEELRTILDYAYEGIVAVNAAGTVTLCNKVAMDMLGGPGKAFPGRPLATPLPGLDFSSALSDGQEETGRLVRTATTAMLVSTVPIRVDGSVVGAVATMHDVTRLQEMEASIRREIYEKGHIAKFGFEDFIACDPVTLAVLEKAKHYGSTDASVVIRGETGTGKELLAQGMHRAGPRSRGPFVAVNCAALPESLLESELFGYVEGAFTGASRKGKPGLFELAHRGTIFLDEVSEIPLSLQGRLLRVLQEREVMRLGHDRIIPVDVRVIAASNKDLGALVAEGGFRSDLFWRLNVLGLYIPPLRERRADIEPLILRILSTNPDCTDKGMALSSEATSFLCAYDWPGNVRELRNFCERLAVLCGRSLVDLETARSLLDVDSYPTGLEGRGFDILDRSLHHGRGMDKSQLRNFVDESGGISEAARLLGIHRSTLWRKLHT